MKRFIKSSYFALIMLFIYVPIFIMIMFSFNDSTSLFNWQGFTWRWYGELVKNSPLIKSLIVSLFVAMVSTMISIVVGLMACVGLAKVRKRVRNNWVRIANIPLVNADVITAIGLMIFFVLAGVRFGTVTLIAAHVSFNVPYVIVTVLPFMLRIDPNMIQASRDLGATPRQTFYRVVLPTLLPSIITAIGICFAMSFDDFIISYFNGGPQTNVSTFIYTQKKLQPFINAFGALLVLTIVTIFLIWNGVAITRRQIIETKIKIKKGEYKIKQIAKINAQIAYLKKSLTTETIIIKSYSLTKWIKYKLLQAKVKHLETKNTDIKISRLEWKKELIKQEIKNEARYFMIFKKLNEKKAQFETKLASTTIEKKRIKFEQIINKLEKRIDKYQSEIDWINERNQNDKNKAFELEAEIKNLISEMEALENPSTKELQWYKKKINKLTTTKNNLALGRNNAKMQDMITKLAEYKKKIASKLVSNYEQLQSARKTIFQIVPFTHKVNKKIELLETANKSVPVELIEIKSNEFEKVRQTLESRLEVETKKLEDIKTKISAKKEKLFPIAGDDGYENNVRTKGWLTKNWKKIAMGTLLTGSFALITTAYIMNNQYDLIIGNWGNYIDMSLLRDFEREYGVKINYQQYDSNESLYNKNYTLNYDLMVPSDYMIKRLAQEGFLARIDWEELNREVEGHKTMHITPVGEEFIHETDETGVPTRMNISEVLQEAMSGITVEAPDGFEGDISDYSLPWIYGDVRLVFNKDNQRLVDWLSQRGVIDSENSDSVEGLNERNLSWSILWDAADAGFNLALNNDPKNVFMYAFQKLFGNIQISSARNAQEEINQAAAALRTLLVRNNVGLYGDELISVTHERNFDIAVMYNGDVIYSFGEDYEPEEEMALSSKSDKNEMLSEGHPNIYVGVPGAPVDGEVDNYGNQKYESTNVFVDNIAIGNNSRNKWLAYRFINFMYRWNSQWAILDETGSTPGFVEMTDAIHEEEYFGPYLTDLINVTENGSLFDLNGIWDNYLVDRFNEIIALKQ